MGEHEVEISIGVGKKIENLSALESQIGEFEKKIVQSGKRLTISAQQMCIDSAKAALGVVQDTSTKYESEVKKLAEMEDKQAKEILKAKERTAREAFRQAEKSAQDSIKSAKKSAQVFVELEREISKAKGRTATEAQVQADKIAKSEIKSARESAKVFIDLEKEKQRNQWKAIQFDNKKYIADMKESAKYTKEFSDKQALAEKSNNSLVGSITKGLINYNLLAKAIGTVVDMFREGVGVVLQFEKGMSLVNTILQEPTEKLRLLTERVAALGTELGKSPEEMAMGLYQVASSTDDTVDRMKVLKDATKASVAGFADVNTAVDAGTSVMNAYKMGINDLPAIYDKMFKTIDRGKVTFSELNQGLSSVISSAVNAKVPLDTMMGQFAFLTQRGLKTEQAATALARSYDAVYEKSKEFKKIFGIEVFDNGQLRDSTTILTELGNVLKKLDPATKIAALQALGLEERAQKAFSLMADNTSDLKEFIDEIANSAGQTDKAFEAANDNIATQWAKMKSGIFEELIKTILDNKDAIIETMKTLKDLGVMIVDLAALVAKPINLVLNVVNVDETEKKVMDIFSSETYSNFVLDSAEAINKIKEQRDRDLLNEIGNLDERRKINKKYNEDIIAMAEAYDKKKAANKAIDERFEKSETQRKYEIAAQGYNKLLSLDKTSKDLLLSKDAEYMKKSINNTKQHMDALSSYLQQNNVSNEISKGMKENLIDKISEGINGSITMFGQYRDNVLNVFKDIVTNSGEMAKVVGENMIATLKLVSSILGGATKADKKQYLLSAVTADYKAFLADAKNKNATEKEKQAFQDARYEFWNSFLNMDTKAQEATLAEMKKNQPHYVQTALDLIKVPEVDLNPDKKVKKEYSFDDALKDFKERMATMNIPENTQEYMSKYVDFLVGSIDDVQKLKDKEPILNQIKGYLADTKSKLDIENTRKKVEEIVKKEADFLSGEASKNVDQSTTEFLSSYKTVIENIIETLAPMGIDTTVFADKLKEINNKIADNDIAKENKKILDKYKSDYESLFKEEDDFFQLAKELGTDTTSEDFRKEMNKMYDKLITDANKLIQDSEQRKAVIQYFKNQKFGENPKDDPYKVKELTPKQKYLNDVMGETISLVSQLGDALGSNLLNAISDVMSGIKAIQTGNAQGGVLGALGAASGYVAIASAVYGAIQGTVDKANAKAEAETRASEEARQKNLDLLSEIANNTKDQLDSFEDLRSTLVGIVSKLPTTSNILAGSNAAQLAYKSLYSQRNFGSINVQSLANQKYFNYDPFNWGTRERWKTISKDFSQEDIGKMLGIDFKTATIDQLKQARDRVTSLSGLTGDKTLGGSGLGTGDWTFWGDISNTSKEFQASLTKYIEMLEQAKQEAEAFERTVKLSSMVGIQVLDSESEKQKLIEQYTKMGIKITDDVKKQIDELVSNMGDFNVTIMQDVRKAIIENGGDVALAMKDYVSAMVNNAFTQVVDSLMEQDFDELTKKFGELVNMQIKGEDVTAKRTEIAKSMLEAIRKSETLTGAKAKETEELIKALRELGATEAELIKLGLLDEAGNQLTELAQNAAEIVKEALKAGFEADADINVFTSKLGEGIYNSVKDALMNAMQSAMYAKMAEKIMGAYDFDKIFQGMSVEEMYKKGQEIMKDVLGKLESSGLDFGNTSANGTSAADKISNAVGISVDKETQGANIVYHNYNYQPYYANPVYYGDGTTEESLFAKFEEYLQRNGKRDY